MKWSESANKFKLAEDCYVKKDYEKARAYYLQIVQDNHEPVVLYLADGKLRLLEKEFVQALNCFKKALSLDRDCVETYVCLGQLCRELGLYSRTVVDFRAIIDGVFSILLGNFFVHPNAVLLIIRLVGAWPNDGPTHPLYYLLPQNDLGFTAYTLAARANIYLGFENFRECEKDALEVLTLHPNFAFAYCILAKLYFLHKNYQESYENLEIAENLLGFAPDILGMPKKEIVKSQVTRGFFVGLKRYSCEEAKLVARALTSRYRILNQPPQEKASAASTAVETTAGEIIPSTVTITFLNVNSGREESHSVEMIREFLWDRMNDWNLPIREIIDQIGDEPVFIIAKTGVGKTVTVPTKVLLGLCDVLVKQGADFKHKYPQVFVVEPRIPICVATMTEMNEGYQDYLAYRMISDVGFVVFLQSQGISGFDSGRPKKDPKVVEKIVKLACAFVKTGKAPCGPHHFNLYGCITSVTGKVNANAPILFVTTGILESMTYEGGKLDANYSRIIIDEAHVTIEQNPAIELGIALARKAGVKIDYMSATVDKATLEQDLGVKVVYAGTQRYPIYLTNLKGKVDDHILQLVQDFLVKPKASLFPHPESFSDFKVQKGIELIRRHLLSDDDFVEDGKEIKGLKHRAQGLLVIVNSHENEDSDTRRIAKLVSKARFNGKKVIALRLASPVIRNPAKKAAFEREIHNIESKNGRYVIVATNVVEMGLTFSSLDYVVTMDSEMNNEFMDGTQVTQTVALGVNALYQRIGRAGRVRPGIAFIAKDFGAPYTKLTDQELAAGLQEAPIRYPLAKGSFQKLALYTFREEFPEGKLKEKIAELQLPSRIQDNSELWKRFLAERKRLRSIGIAVGDKLSENGRRALGFLGVEDLSFAYLLAEVLHRYEKDHPIALFFTLIAAASGSGFDKFLKRGVTFEGQPALEVVEVIPKELLESSSQLIRDLVSQGYVPVKDEETFAGKKGDSRFEEDVVRLHADDDFGGFIHKDAPKKDLRLKRRLIELHARSELFNIWRLYRYFFERYISQFSLSTFSEVEQRRLRDKMFEEADSLQVVASAIFALHKGFMELCKQIRITLPTLSSDGNRSVLLAPKEEEQLIEASVRELLHERQHTYEDFGLCMELYRLQDGGKADFRKLSSLLKEKGFETHPGKVKDLYFLIIRDARGRFEKHREKVEAKEVWNTLPDLTMAMEEEILKLLVTIGYHQELTLRQTKEAFATTVQDQFGQEIPASFYPENTPLRMSFENKTEVRVLAKLTPKLPKAQKYHEKPSEQDPLKGKTFLISHITVLR